MSPWRCCVERVAARRQPEQRRPVAEATAALKRQQRGRFGRRKGCGEAGVWRGRHGGVLGDCVWQAAAVCGRQRRCARAAGRAGPAMWRARARGSRRGRVGVQRRSGRGERARGRGWAVWRGGARAVVARRRGAGRGARPRVWEGARLGVREAGSGAWLGAPAWRARGPGAAQHGAVHGRGGVGAWRSAGAGARACARGVGGARAGGRARQGWRGVRGRGRERGGPSARGRRKERGREREGERKEKRKRKWKKEKKERKRRGEKERKRERGASASAPIAAAVGHAWCRSRVTRRPRAKQGDGTAEDLDIGSVPRGIGKSGGR